MGCVLTFEKVMSIVPDSNMTAPPKEKAKAAEIVVMYRQNTNRNWDT
jgi:hypothetical protein